MPPKTSLILRLQKTSEIEWSKYWNPQLYIDNVVGEPRETVWQTIMFDSDMKAFVFEKRRIAGTFVENLELYQFPFDTQVATVFMQEGSYTLVRVYTF